MFNIVKRFAGKSALKIAKYSPQILIGAGVVGTGIALIMVAKRSSKAAVIQETYELSQDNVGEDKISKKALVKEYVKLYAAPASVWVASAGCILAGFNIINKRNVAIMAAYTLTDQAFQEYREKVKSLYGKDKDEELRYGASPGQVKSLAAKCDDGLEKDVLIEEALSRRHASMYARMFDETNPNWSHDIAYMYTFLTRKLQWANDVLRSRGYLYLNEVYDELGFPLTKAGQVVGWIYSFEANNFVSFGPWMEEFGLQSKDLSILLDFNVDGIIWDKI